MDTQALFLDVIEDGRLNENITLWHGALGIIMARSVPALTSHYGTAQINVRV